MPTMPSNQESVVYDHHFVILAFVLGSWKLFVVVERYVYAGQTKYSNIFSINLQGNLYTTTMSKRAVCVKSCTPDSITQLCYYQICVKSSIIKTC